MARRNAALERWGLPEFEALLTPHPGAEEPGAAAAAAPEASGDGSAPEPSAGAPAPAAPPAGGPAEAPPAVLLLFDRGTPDDVRLARVLAAAAAARSGGRLRVGAVAADAALPRLKAWQEGRRAYDTFDFERWPAVGVFRGGRLVTTFHPRRVFHPDALQEREEAEQVEIFLSKMVDYDPARVKEQKSLKLEAGA